jgi:hypothetical protein
MSDFLDSLLSRSAGEAVRPRPVSLFEPLPGTAWRTLALESEAAAGPEQEGARPAPGSGDAARPVSRAREPATLRDARPVADGPGPPSLVIRAPEPSRTVLPPRSAPPVTGSPDPGNPPQPAVIRTVLQRVVQQQASPPAEPSPATDIATRQAGGPQVAPAPVTVRAMAGTPTVAADPPAMVPARLPRATGGEVRPAPEASRPAGAGEPPQAQQPQPVIQVTIGRIEVRATPVSAALSRKATPAAPMTSLEDYLRQRKGGAR